MNNDQNKKFNIANEAKGRGLFYGVIAIATFIIMAVGATFAYFTATTESMNSAVQTGSTTLQLKFISYGEAWMNDDLIPADSIVVEYSVESQDDSTINTDPKTGSPVDEEGVAPVKGNNTMCKDDFGNSICSLYAFQVTNASASPQLVSLNVISETNTFGNLRAMAYEVTAPTEDDDTMYDEENTLYSKYTTIYNPGDELLKKETNGRNDPDFRNDENDTDGTIDVTDETGALTYNFTPVYINRAGTIKKLLSHTTNTGEGTTSTTPAMDKKLVIINETNANEDASKRTAQIANNIEIDSRETKTFVLVLYIWNDPDHDQTKDDAEKEFSGQVTIMSGDGGTGVSGSIGAVSADNFDPSKLQSNQNASQE